MSLLWSYGLTTVYHRRNTTLKRTLLSLQEGGFPTPHLFVDNCQDPEDWRREFNLPITPRHPYIRTYGNWLLALWELYIRQPFSDRFAIFQDDLVCVKNLRNYLEVCKYPKNGYVNLYTTRDNESHIPCDTNGKYLTGFWPSNQLGKGALALIFSREAAAKLLASPQTVERLTTPHTGTGNVDGCVVHNLSDRHIGPPGWKEYIHYPSLVQHTGTQSTMDHRHMENDRSPCFVGEDFDAMNLLEMAKMQLLNYTPTPNSQVNPKVSSSVLSRNRNGMLRKFKT